MIKIYQITLDQMRELFNHRDMPRLTYNEIKIIIQTAEMSRPLLAVFYDDELLGFYGLVPHTIFSDSANIWLYHTPKVSNHPIAFARRSRSVIKDMLELYPRILGFCATQSAAFWVDWCGADWLTPINGIRIFEFRRS
jgi:hypothetical protein